ncbi:MAG: hypothetical protein R3264_19325, partial [Anaerolineae bacterium]|nr:hypothetical protein [Anaerolineae bacterium]
EVAPGADLVQRITTENSDLFLDAPVYGSQEKVEHDPFQLFDNPIGPYAKGADLGFTMEAWLAGTGRGTYTVGSQQAEIDLTFENLVPNGVYTIWCAHIFAPPEFQIVDEPCGNADGSQNTVVTDGAGNAEFNLTLKPLPDTSDKVTRVIAAAYHSDGKTYGSYPGDFGLNSHVQILAIIPSPEDTAWRTVENTALAQR